MLTSDKRSPLVTIVAATYNGERFLRPQLDSLVNQTYPNLEIIVLDDCSKDGTWAILEEYAARYPHFQIHRNDNNLGYIKNFEKVSGMAKGAYISYADQDDVWDLDKTQLLMDAIGDHPMIYCDSAMVDGNLESLGISHNNLKKLQDFDNPLYFATDNCVGGHALIAKREVVMGSMPFPTVMPHDLWLAFNATLHGTILYYDKAMVKWRQHGFNVTKDKKPQELKIREARERLQTFAGKCDTAHAKEKQVLEELYESYASTGFGDSWKRMVLFFKYKKYFLAMKRRNEFRKDMFCLKMFVKIREHVA
ncbi:Glycosyl transferase family 2 [Chitinophaga jiangningensis]|uniref:Glycosyl transferase family 2 n=1 Tax=Chitinophaga jiangningensis TaxID=1419482 RepID=A0A1M7GZX5_9BACT|nr:glycosyltransferase [Chitinophaga jiangningensis]SHM21952.1 Glycosyl transferase family 2 [Chitinophaga jiangningensis]